MREGQPVPLEVHRGINTRFAFTGVKRTPRPSATAVFPFFHAGKARDHERS
jgi:hypothetical protein